MSKKSKWVVVTDLDLVITGRVFTCPVVFPGPVYLT